MGIVLHGYYDIVLVFDTLWLVCICFGEALLHEKSPCFMKIHLIVSFSVYWASLWYYFSVPIKFV